MSTSSYNRPGTPFPFSSSPSSSSSSTRRMSQPLHFAVPSLPVRTPPSLLKRSASSVSSGSNLSLSRTPENTSSRRLSDSSAASSSSSSSSPLIATPALYRSYPHAFEADHDVEVLDLAEAAMTLSPPEHIEYAKPPMSAARPKLVRGNAVPLPPTSSARYDDEQRAAKQVKLSRPKFLRRDTPRPITNSLGMTGMASVPEAVPRRQGSFTSMVDGGKWVVV